MQHGAGLNEIALAFVNTTSRNYFGKMNSTLGSVVPLAMFLIGLFGQQDGEHSSPVFCIFAMLYTVCVQT